MDTRFRLAFATVLTAGTLGTVAACGHSHGTGSITPAGTRTGTFHYCSYTPTGSGIKISHYEATPCVVDDTRTTSERKSSHTHVVTTHGTHHASTGGSSLSKALKKTTKSSKVNKSTGGFKSSKSYSLKKH